MTNPAVLSAIDAELVRVENYVAQLRQKVRALLPDNSTVQGHQTAGPDTTPTLPVNLTTHGAFHPRGFCFRGTFQRCDSYIDIYLGLLRSIARHMPDAMQRTAFALQRHGRIRRYLAPEPAQLFQGKTADWARSHSCRVVDGWYADTNLSLNTMRQQVRRILRANGLCEGTDVVIVWNRRPVDAEHTMPSSRAH